ncbi:MAG: DNA recombination protein RmuC [Angelakisella sp.]
MEQIIIILLVFLLAVILYVAVQSAALTRNLRRLEADRQLDTQQEQSTQAALSQLRLELLDAQRGQRQDLASTLSAQTLQLENRLRSLTVDQEQRLENIRMTMEKQLTALQQDNNKQLTELRETVDARLQKTLEDTMTQSFGLVNQRLKQVYEGLGEMRTLAAGVGDLKKVLGNVKTRGILGEIQLGAILGEILAPQQYAVNVATKAGSRAVVEYAVKLPTEDGETIWLPIDAKFPADAYAALRDAYDTGDPAAVQAAMTVLQGRIKGFAKDIRDKYLDPPNTTEFGIMFLPFEGLYAEVISSGLVEVLQRDYRVNVAGPSTMAALLNSLQMGFKAFAIQKRSSEVWAVLGAVKTEFERFAVVLQSTQTRLGQAEQELDKLVGVRTRIIQKRLSNITALTPADTAALLPELEEPEPFDTADSENC